MAWRLGTWTNESLVERLEDLLGCAERLPNWPNEQRKLASADFAEFWSVVWQLQVAEHLHRVGADVCWAKSGPDLSVQIRGVQWFIECYVYRKSFGLFLFLEEVLEQLDPDVRVRYDLCLPFQLPQDKKRSQFLHQVLSPVVDPDNLASAKERAKRQYPVVLFDDPKSSLKVFVEGRDVLAYVPGIVSKTAGDPTSYLRVALREAIRAKRNSNSLEEHHPNLVAVNFLLSADYQVAQGSRIADPGIATPDDAPNIDVLAVSVAGIDKQLTREDLELVKVDTPRRLHSSLYRIAAR